MEDVYFTVTVDTPPIIAIPTPIVIYEDIKTKVSLASTVFYDIDMHNFIDYKIYSFPATVPETWPSVNNIRLDWGENIDFNIFYLYYTAPGTYRYILQAIDIYDKVTYYQFNVQVLANNPPTTIGTPITHTVESGAAFSFTHSALLFNEADAGDSISAVYMTWGGSPLPSWMAYSGTTYTYSGTAPTVGVTTTYILTIYAFDT